MPLRVGLVWDTPRNGWLLKWDGATLRTLAVDHCEFPKEVEVMNFSQLTVSSGVVSERVGDELLVIAPG